MVNILIMIMTLILALLICAKVVRYADDDVSDRAFKMAICIATMNMLVLFSTQAIDTFSTIVGEDETALFAAFVAIFSLITTVLNAVCALASAMLVISINTDD